MNISKVDQIITEEAVTTYKQLLKFWLYSLPAFLLVVCILKYSSELHLYHFYGLVIFIFISFFLVMGIYSLLDYKRSRGMFLFIYVAGIIYPLLSPLVVFGITNLYAPDFALSIMNHTIPSLFLIMTMATGFSFSFRVSVLSGVLSGCLFTICFFWLRSNHPDAIEDRLQMVGFSYFTEILVYILLSGILSGLLANQARRMLSKIYDSIQEREFISTVLGEYVSKEVKDKILKEGGLHNEGEERDVTVLFADLRDFTSLSEIWNPKEIVELLNEYFDSMVEVIQKNGGVIDKFIGDAIMAYFGAPVSIPNPQKQAYKASREMLEQLNHLNLKFLDKGLPILKQGIGLHHGTVVIGNIGSKTRKNYTIIGDAVNLASRLESMTKEVQKDLIASESVHRALDEVEKQDFDLVENIQLKGKRDTIPIFILNPRS